MAIIDRPDEVVGAPWGAQSVNREYANTRDLQLQLAKAIIPEGGGASTFSVANYTSPLATLVDPAADFTKLIAEATAVGGDGKAHLIWVRDATAANGAFTGYGYFAVRSVDSATQIKVYDPSGYLNGLSAVSYTATFDTLHAAAYGQLHDNVNSQVAALMAQPVVSGSLVYETSVYGPQSIPPTLASAAVDLSSVLGPLGQARWAAVKLKLTGVGNATDTVKITLKTAASAAAYSRQHVLHPPASSLIQPLYEEEFFLLLESNTLYLDAEALGSLPQATVELALYGLGG